VKDDLNIETPVDESLSLEEIFRHRREVTRVRKQAETARALIRVKLSRAEPIGILHFGDPHLDDDHVDLDEVAEHCELVKNTEGLYGANVGDTTNNWIGRLQRLYAAQTTRTAEAWKLVEWFANACPWLYWLGGNHDLWSGDQDPIKYIADKAGIMYQWHGARLQLEFPNEVKFKINAAHQFPGYSIYNKAHAVMREAQRGLNGYDVVLQGHTHVTGYGLHVDPETQLITHCLQVAAYKGHDEYAKSKGMHPHRVEPCVMTVFDPFAERPSERVHVIHSPKHGAEFLTWLREKRAAG